ncbi:hypothetical protein ASPWEDRAFT_71317 [Aspergillus wentii DTO 134E9]|uniref:Pesticidal crystal protein domain-containing protein n=1 Tax=Aspergillus wentii DTO 134E9 TaxID=1073089 RepID=A0A1L9RAS3_ASPWE|nr:uncharacterized protein ASPWEDRAFT_71317 [Aspergillus wentii DTO 134E9]KAI9934542.1 hypothetical protein MW887_000156 [Aspergillus wentii]OJJ31957.1 hypothetical protein ASPWEDRAFT_71317 [Aspergillus wentii DTO 134E9]
MKTPDLYIPGPAWSIRIVSLKTNCALFSRPYSGLDIWHPEPDFWHHPSYYVRDDQYWYMIPGKGKFEGYYYIKNWVTHKVIYSRGDQRPYVGTDENNEDHGDHYFKLEPGTGVYNGCFRLRNYASDTCLISRDTEPEVYNCRASDAPADEQYFKFDLYALLDLPPPSSGSSTSIGPWAPSPNISKMINLNGLLKMLAGFALSQVPHVGGLLSGIIGLYWPDENESLTWAQIEAGVRSIVRDMLDEEKVKELRKEVEVLKDLIKRYDAGSFGTQQKAEKFNYILDHFTTIKRNFLDNETPWHTLQYFIPMATLHLTFLRHQLFLWDEIYPEDAGADKEVHQKDLEDAIKEYTAAAEKIFEKCIAWRMEQTIFKTPWIKTEWVVNDPPQFRFVHDYERDIVRIAKWNVGTHLSYPPNETYRDTAHEDPNDKWQLPWEHEDIDRRPKLGFTQDDMVERYYHDLRDSADAIYRQQIKDLLAPSLQWPQFINDNKGQYTPVPRDVICTTTETLGSGITTGMTHFNDREFAEKHGPISQIAIWGWDRVEGFEIWYGGVGSGHRGGYSGEKKMLQVGEGESVVCVSGRISEFQQDNSMVPGGADDRYCEYLHSIRFFVSQEKSISCGGDGGAGEPKMPDNFRLGQPYNGPTKDPATPRVMYVYGWASDEHIEGFGASLVKTESV